MNKELSIHLSAFAPSIAQQLRKQGFRYTPEKAKKFERLSKNIIGLYLNNIVKDAEKKKMNDRLFAQIKRHVAQMNRLKPVADKKA